MQLNSILDLNYCDCVACSACQWHRRHHEVLILIVVESNYSCTGYSINSNKILLIKYFVFLMTFSFVVNSDI